jgi:hypothetical protein
MYTLVCVSAKILEVISVLEILILQELGHHCFELFIFLTLLSQVLVLATRHEEVAETVQQGSGRGFCHIYKHGKRVFVVPCLL